ARRYGLTRRVVLCPLFVHAAHVSSSYGYPTMRWIPPNLLNRARSSSDGSYTPLGWEWTVPTTEKSAGRVWSWKIAWCLPLIVPGTRRSSSIVPWSARKIAPNSRGYMSREASRIMRRVFREIASTRFIVASLAGQLLLDATIEVVPEPDELRPSLRGRHGDVLAPFQARFVLAVHHHQAFLGRRRRTWTWAEAGKTCGRDAGLNGAIA